METYQRLITGNHYFVDICHFTFGRVCTPITNTKETLFMDSHPNNPVYN